MWEALSGDAAACLAVAASGKEYVGFRLASGGAKMKDMSDCQCAPYRQFRELWTELRRRHFGIGDCTSMPVAAAPFHCAYGYPGRHCDDYLQPACCQDGRWTCGSFFPPVADPQCTGFGPVPDAGTNG